jgi:hypothetical protein
VAVRVAFQRTLSARHACMDTERPEIALHARQQVAVTASKTRPCSVFSGMDGRRWRRVADREMAEAK